MKNYNTINILKRATLAMLLATLPSPLVAALEQGSDFTYQGFLTDGGAPANGVYDLQFTVYNAVAVGAPVGATTTVPDLAISNGLFTVTISPGAGVFDGAALWLQIALRPGASGGAYSEVTPRQPIMAMPYAVTAGTLAGNGAIGSAQLADTVALGVTNQPGRLDIYHTPVHTPSITLFGAGGQISTYGDDGLEQVRLGNNTFGELRLFNSLANNAQAVHLTANGSGGGYLTLQNTNGATRASLAGANSGGILQLYQADGGAGFLADADSDGAGIVQVKNSSGQTRVSLDGQSTGEGGEISISAANGFETVQLLGQVGGNMGGSLKLSQDNGTTGALLEGESGGNGEGGALKLYNGLGDLTVQIDGDFNNASKVFFYQADGDALFSASEDAGAGTLIVYDASGASKVLIEGEDSAGGGRVTADSFRCNVDMGIARVPTANAFEVQGNASKSVAGSWLANSDARIKTDVQTVTGALETLSRIRLVDFRYTDDYRKSHSDIADRRYLNVIAQEFREVFPDHVKSSGEKLTDGSEILQVDTYPLTIYSAAAVQELNDQLKQKQEAIEDLQQTVNELCRTVRAIEKKQEQKEK